MARYRKIDSRMWGDEKFRSLSRPQPNGQSLWMYLLTGPHTDSCPGLYSVGEMAIAEELEWSLKGLRKAFQELFAKGMAKADFKARVILLPNVKKYDPPDNPNVVKKWAKDFDEIPECELKDEYFEILKDFIKGFGKPFQEAFDKGFGNTRTRTITRTLTITKENRIASSDPQNGSLEALYCANQETFKKAYPGINLENETAKAKAWLESNPKNKKSNLKRFLNSWFNRAQDKINRFPPREEKFL